MSEHDDSSRDRLAHGFFAFGGSTFVAAATTVTLASTTFAIGGAVASWQLATGLAAGIAVILLSRPSTHSTWRSRGSLAGLWLTAVVGSVALSGLVYDVSFDGQNYHLEGVLALANGWNPFADWSAPQADAGTVGTYVTHYPKGPWILAAAIYRATGWIETAKAFNLLYAIGALALASSTALRLWPERPRAALSLATLTAINPVIVTQLATFYVDGQFACIVTALAALLPSLDRDRGPLPRVVLASLVILAANTKFTGVVYPIVLCGVWWAVAALRARPVTGLATFAASLVVATCLVGFQPYVVNTITKGDPFFPVSSAFTLRSQIPQEFLARDRVTKLALSTFARGSKSRYEQPRLKVPFAVDLDEVRAYAGFDTRIAGFGPFFGGALLVAAALLLACSRADRRLALRCAVVCVTLVASALAVSDPWWARFAPQLWAVPIAVCALALDSRNSRAARRAGAALAAILLANAALVAGANAWAVWSWNRDLRRQIAFFRDVSRTAPLSVRFTAAFGSSRVRLAEAGVAFVDAEHLPCADPVALERSFDHTTVCLPPDDLVRYRALFGGEETE